MNRILYLLPLFLLICTTLNAQETNFRIPPALEGNNGRVLVGMQGGTMYVGMPNPTDSAVTLIDSLKPGAGLPDSLTDFWAFSMPDKENAPMLVMALVSYTDQDTLHYGIMKSTDMGASWTLSMPPQLRRTNFPVLKSWWTQPLSKFKWLDVNTGWLYGKRGILRTTNGGADWEIMNTQTDSTIWEMDFKDADNGAGVIGPAGTLKFMKTTDGGRNWSFAATSLGPKRVAQLDYRGGEYRALGFDRFQTSRNTTMYFSNDGFLWDPENKPVIVREQSHMSEIVWAAVNAGFMVLRSGELWATVDGGHTWEPEQNADSTAFPIPSFGWGQKSIMLDGNDIVHVVTTSNNGSIYRLLHWPVTVTVSAPEKHPLQPGVAVSAWPNPTSDQLHVRYRIDQAAGVTVTLVDQLGRVVLRRDVASRAAGEHQLTLDATGLPAGLYRLLLGSSATPAGTAPPSVPVTVVR
jgi:hypothetical protein